MSGEKNPMVAALLGVFCGCFGLFYVSISQGIIALLVVIAISAATGGAAAPVIWLGCAVWGYIAADQHNERLRSLAKLDHPDVLGYDAGNDSYAAGRLAAGGGSEQPSGPGWSNPQSSAGSQEARQFCGSCGASLQSGARFCIRCGKGVG